MSALVKLSTISRQSNYMRFVPANEDVTIRGTATMMGVQISGGNMIAATGDDAGEFVDAIKAGKRGIINLGTINPSKYQVLVECNPALHAIASVGHARIIEPGDNIPLELHISANKTVDVSALDWVVRLYMLD